MTLNTPENDEIATEKKETYTPGPNAVDISPNKDNGLLKEIIKEGIGFETPARGSKVCVHYVGTLTDGTKFDSSRDRGEPFDFELGKGHVIKAWEIGVASMRKKEIAVLTCKSEYAYGKAGSPPKIPADATLIFEIEVLDWTGEDLSPGKDKSICRYQITPGDGLDTPSDGDDVEVDLVGKYNGEIFETRSVTFSLGEGSEFGVCEGIEVALEKFSKGEQAKLEIKSKYAFKKEGRPDLNIPPNADVEYEVTLKNFEKAKELWILDGTERLEKAKFFKEKGTNYFKAGKYQLAIRMYKKIISFLEHATGFDEEQDKERQSLLLAGHLNLAMCFLKIEEHTEAQEHCNKALAIQPSNEKGLFRRGQCYLGMGEPELAKTDFEAVIKLEPGNKAAANSIITCNIKIKEQKGREKKIYANMFEKFAQRDKEVLCDLVNGWWDGNKVVTERDDGLVPPPPPKKSISEFKKVVTCKREIQNPAEDAESNVASSSNIDNTKPPNGDCEKGGRVEAQPA